ncbi:BCCT family transporter [Glutamicibacter protophormiae]|uniref:Choline/carnitine/betaine transport n=1 Tax=Glutamicibacter protophormiae TaxID=37930 RepID=A0ABS4XNW7_GLUPR|nr:BCCT family transporter [Glutamicibacter protophormiae]MBP2398214.1 choline/carnitine/betaine transport [Glutamicibacter protophormiae]GGL90609.1 BCCT family transporter [Glutamicibacter protophormiae]
MKQSDQSIEEIVGELHSARQRKPKKYMLEGIDYWVFGIAGALALAFIIWGFVTPDGLGTVADAALDWVITNTGWLFIIAASVFAVFVIVVAAKNFGRIPLGKDDEKPQFSTVSWISMMFATGMGIGLVFYGVGEPLYFYMSPPPGTVEGQTDAALSTAMGTTLFHWTLFPWAMYAIVGLGMAYGSFRLGRPQLFSSMFTPIFGDRAIHGLGGRVINILAIIATLFGSACSLGLGALQIGGGIQATGMMEKVGSGVLVVIIAILTALFVASAISGIERGIQWLSNTNMVLAVILALIVFIGGPTLFILNVIPNAIGSFIGDLPQMASRTAASGDEAVSSWLSSWTVFYWAWWVSWTPFVGLFIARISRGRTIRQFVTGVLLVPSTVTLLWFAIFGGGAIGIQERAERAGDTSAQLAQIVDGAPDINFDLILFDMLEQLPVAGWVSVVLMVLAVLLIAIFFVTGADSASIVMGALSEKGAENPTRKSVVFWGVATGAVAAVMLLAGGDNPAEALNGLKNITIVTALPFVVVMLLLCVAIWKDLSRDPLILRSTVARQVLENSVSRGVDRHEGSGFSLMTTEIPVVEAAKLGTERGAVVEEREVLLATEPAEPTDSKDPAEPKSRGPEKS